MAQIEWTLPALAELEAIADYIALDNPSAAAQVVDRIFSAVEQLGSFPTSGARVPGKPKSKYRQLVVKPCRLFYKVERGMVWIVFIMRQERMFHDDFLA